MIFRGHKPSVRGSDRDILWLERWIPSPPVVAGDPPRHPAAPAGHAIHGVGTARGRSHAASTVPIGWRELLPCSDFLLPELRGRTSDVQKMLHRGSTSCGVGRSPSGGATLRPRTDIPNGSKTALSGPGTAPRILGESYVLADVFCKESQAIVTQAFDFETAKGRREAVQVRIPPPSHSPDGTGQVSAVAVHTVFRSAIDQDHH